MLALNPGGPFALMLGWKCVRNRSLGWWQMLGTVDTTGTLGTSAGQGGPGTAELPKNARNFRWAVRVPQREI